MTEKLTYKGIPVLFDEYDPKPGTYLVTLTRREQAEWNRRMVKLMKRYKRLKRGLGQRVQ